MNIVEKIAQMMICCGLATKHWDAIDDSLFELKKQIKNTSNAFSDAQKEIKQLREVLTRIERHPVEESKQWEVAVKEMKRLARSALPQK
jgi:predicted  nucleic acid-binding Zn-ribbon protein